MQVQVTIQQEQILRAIVAARAEIQAAVALFQAAIQQAGGGPVTLTADAIQAVTLRLRATAQALAIFRSGQVQIARVIVGGVDINAEQRQVVEAALAAAAAVDAALEAFQRLLLMAQTGGGQVTISQAAAQMLLVSLQAVAESLAALELRQRQLIQVSTQTPPAGGGQVPPFQIPGLGLRFPQFPGFGGL
ncbi:MAG TPA: hypothetical protein VD902_10245 [Symbiobacteriaceae bacterium]|nr:hypothetical protein [Symbiobacteriaceae bacterium]